MDTESDNDSRGLRDPMKAHYWRFTCAAKGVEPFNAAILGDNPSHAISRFREIVGPDVTFTMVAL